MMKKTAPHPSLLVWILCWILFFGSLCHFDYVTIFVFIRVINVFLRPGALGTDQKKTVAWSPSQLSSQGFCFVVCFSTKELAMESHVHHRKHRTRPDMRFGHAIRGFRPPEDAVSSHTECTLDCGQRYNASKTFIDKNGYTNNMF